MRWRMAILVCALCLMLTGCGHALVEAAPLRVGNPVLQATPEPSEHP